MWPGFWSAELVPSPKFQTHAVGTLEEVSLKLTVTGTIPEVGAAVKLATGTGTETVMQLLWVLVLVPPTLLTVRVTV